MKEAACAAGSAINPVPAAFGGDPIVIEDDKPIFIENDEPIVCTKDKPIVINYNE